MTPDPFDHYVAIDWSGARGVRHKTIAVVDATPGTTAPAIVPPPAPGGWARREIVDWLAALPGRVLAGFDFSFAPPWFDRGAYFPGVATPDTAIPFWAWIDQEADDADLGAASFLEVTERPFFYFGKADGRKADFMRLRACERAFNATGGGKPSSIFDAIGAAQVAKASFAGMRVLHHLHEINGAKGYTIWPFEQRSARTIVEIYTRSFLKLAGGNGQKIRSRDILGDALRAFGSAAPAASRHAFSDHETDALVAAAGLRCLAPRATSWAPAGLTPDIARREGWTFSVGVPFSPLS